MSPNRIAAGKQIAKTRQEKDPDVYRKIGAIGGRKGAKDGAIKGFAAVPGLASRAGKLGGKARHAKRKTQHEPTA